MTPVSGTTTVPVIAVAAIVFDEQWRTLVVERGRAPGVGLWTVPGGKVEPGEKLVEAVVREVLEETGLVVEVGALAAVVERIGPDYHFVILDYCARVIGGTLQPASDVRDARWVDDATLSSLNVTDGLFDVLGQARATHGAWFSSR